MRVVSKLLRGSLMAALFSVAAACLLGADPDIAALRIKAEAGDAEAEFNLGRALGDTKETTEAIKWFRKAADQGYPFAEARLGMVYATGSGVDSGLKQDIPEGLKWLRKAAEQDAGLAEFLGMQLSGVMGDKSRLPKDQINTRLNKKKEIKPKSARGKEKKVFEPFCGIDKCQKGGKIKENSGLTEVNTE